MRELCYTFGEIPSELFWGWYIAAASYRQKNNTETVCRIFHRTNRLVKIISQNHRESLTVTLLSPNVNKLGSSIKNELKVDRNEHFWRTFSQEEIDEFLIKTGDSNPIHSGENAIVPGLLIMSAMPLGDCTRIDFRFLKPVIEGQSIDLAYTEKTSDSGVIHGIVCGLECFQAEYKK